jgi:hypothetical protein
MIAFILIATAVLFPAQVLLGGDSKDADAEGLARPGWLRRKPW